MGIRYKAPLAIINLPRVLQLCAGMALTASAKVEGGHAAIMEVLPSGYKEVPERYCKRSLS